MGCKKKIMYPGCMQILINIPLDKQNTYFVSCATACQTVMDLAACLKKPESNCMLLMGIKVYIIILVARK